jgi:hypothetical protein
MIDLPAKVKGFRSATINALIDYAKAITPRQSADVEPNVSQSGATFRLRESARPFSVKINGTRETGMFPVLREWRMNADTKRAEVVPADEENQHDDEVAELEKNPIIPTWQYDLLPEDFGIKSIAGTVVTLYAGEITIGLTGYTCADTALTVTTETAYLGWDFNIDTSRLSIVNFGSTFLRDPAHIRKWLFLVQKYTVVLTPAVGETPAVTEDRVRILKRGRMNDVFPANMG